VPVNPAGQPEREFGFERPAAVAPAAPSKPKTPAASSGGEFGFEGG
jgi:hypothetical protein